MTSGTTDATVPPMRFSDLVPNRVAHHLALLGLRRLVDEYQAEHGAFTDEERAEAKAAFDAAGVPDHRLQPRAPRSAG